MLSQDEIRGDWNNLKGTEYHLAYALWLLLRGQAARVVFYDGNDLRAEPVSPPQAMEESTPAISIRIQRGIADNWIQLKSTFEPWRPSEFFEGNLLENFVCNALTSLQSGRAWEVRLVTQAIVKKKDLLAFLERPDKQPILFGHLNRVIDNVSTRITSTAGAVPAVDTIALRDLALTILRSLAETQPVALATLKGEIEAELAYAHPSRHAVQRVANLLLGGLLRDAAAGPGRARAYDLDWANEVAGPGLKAENLFDRDETIGCDEAVARSLPPNWKPEYFASRIRVTSLLTQFLRSRETLFVLLGKGGIGKSWAVANWTAIDLAHQIRLLFPTSTIELPETLDELVATSLSPLSDVPLRDHEFLERFRAAALGKGVAPVIVIDDLQAWLGTSELLQRRLTRIVSRARAKDIKIVLTCQPDTWDVFQLWKGMPPGEIFTLDPMAGEEYRRFSFRLDDFSPDEQLDAVLKRLAPPNGETASLQLRAPGFTPLLNPYLFSLYLSQFSHNLGSDTTTPDPVIVDELLGERVRFQVARAAGILGTPSEEVDAALKSLVNALWRNRPLALLHGDAVRSMAVHLPGQGKESLVALQRAGLVTIQGGVRLAEEPVANYLFAKAIANQVSAGGSLESLLFLDRDRDIAASLIRNAVDPITVADRLIQKDVGWSATVCVGLSQCSPHDPRVIAMLVGLSRPQGDDFANIDECCSLGRLAARGGAAWSRVLGMYLGENSHERHRGEVALGASLEVVPELVGDAVRKRLALTIGRHPEVGDRDQLGRLAEALSPLRQVEHRAAATVARSLLPEACKLVPEQRSIERERLIDVIDDIRGRVAQFGDEGELAGLCAELVNPELQTRFRAAGALRPLAFESPQRMKGPVLERLRNETEPLVLSRVLWMAPRIAETYPDEFLDALSEGKVVAWDHYVATGPALAILGIPACVRPDRVMEILPRRLDACEPSARALLSELLVYAWWAVANSRPEAGTQLRKLEEPDLDGVPDSFRTFAFRGSALARLAGLCPKDASFREMGVHKVHFRSAMLPEYLFLDAGEFLRKHANHLARQPGYQRAEDALIDCLLANRARCEGLSHEDLQNARFFCAGNSLEILVSNWAVIEDPSSGLVRLPRDWEALRAARKLLEMGRTEASIRAFARKACDDSANQHTMQAWHERQECIVQLSRIGEAPQAELLGQRVSMAHSFLAPSSRARGLTSLIDQHPLNVLNLLDTGIERHSDIPMLYEWCNDCRAWQAVLISEVYGRMFDPSAITFAEAIDLIEKMLSALRALPACRLRDAHEQLYETIRSWLDRTLESPPPYSEANSPIEVSHSLAMQCLNKANSPGQLNLGGEWLNSFLADRRGWWETTEWKLQRGKLLRGSGLYLVYVFPAVRLTLIAIGHHYGITDPSAPFMDARSSAQEVIHRFHWILTGRDGQPEQIEKALATLRSHAASAPPHEKLLSSCGSLLLQLGRVDQARSALEQSLELPTSSGNNRAIALYDLACVEARSGDTAACQRLLIESRKIRPLNPAWMRDDPDLQTVTSEAWFQELLLHPSEALQ